MFLYFCPLLSLPPSLSHTHPRIDSFDCFFFYVPPFGALYSKHNGIWHIWKTVELQPSTPLRVNATNITQRNSIWDPRNNTLLLLVLYCNLEEKRVKFAANYCSSFKVFYNYSQIVTTKTKESRQECRLIRSL